MKHIGIVAPLIPEARCFTNSPVRKQAVSISDRLSLIVSGEGQVRASEATNTLLELGVDGLIVVGMAGALDPALSPGDLLIPEVIISESNQKYYCDKVWSSHIHEQIHNDSHNISIHPLYTSANVICKSEDKLKLHQQIQACAVDMESAAVMALAYQHKIPCMVIRTIIDPVNYAFPDYIFKLTDEFGEIPLTRLIPTVLLHPLELKKLYQLVIYYHQATLTLKKIANLMGKLTTTGH